MPKVKDLTVDEFKELVQQTVEQKLIEMFGDPDEGLELREDFKARFKQRLAKERKRAHGTPASEVAKKLGLNW